MRIQQRPVDSIHKTRIRDQIRNHVEEYLRRGGEIRVVDNGVSAHSGLKAAVWHGHDEVRNLID